MKLHSPSCARNQEPILAVLREVLPPRGLVFEVGSGTGQHAAYFARHLPEITWQPSNQPDAAALASIEAWRAQAQLPNLLAPLEFDLFDEPCALAADDELARAVVAINVVHIASWPAARRLFLHAAKLLQPGGVLYLYGPFIFPDRPLEPSNVDFDRWLKARDPESGIREIEALDACASEHGFTLRARRTMPANNTSLWWSFEA